MKMKKYSREKNEKNSNDNYEKCDDYFDDEVLCFCMGNST